MIQKTNSQGLIKAFQLFFFFFISFSAFSQEDYVVTVKGDTVYGKVSAQYSGIAKRVRLTTKQKEKTFFPILEIKSFRLKGDIYHTIRKTEGYFFMKLLQSGYLSLYNFQRDGQNTFDGYYLVKKDGDQMEVPNLGFKKGLIKFLGDCEDVKQKIEEGEFKKSDLTKIITEYNLCIDSRSIPADNNDVTKNEKDLQREALIENWSTLSEQVKGLDSLSEKESVLEMMAEVQSKLERNENIPNFLRQSLKNALSSYPEINEKIDEMLGGYKPEE